MADGATSSAVTSSATSSAAEDWERAKLLFDARDYIVAARILSGLVADHPEQNGPRLLLARAYYHSAALSRAESELRALLERDAGDAYAHLLLGRALERMGRAEEAVPYTKVAKILGA
ncbi:tetratricopeptide repeat protein [Streptomyces sp. NPDC093109]|uniref:tetratricopeptide repeat protein n=1 Tax=Streptomyces sp. NPDC093109 TaxID=3154977 RepID=UPI00344FAC9A